MEGLYTGLLTSDACQRILKYFDALTIKNYGVIFFQNGGAGESLALPGRCRRAAAGVPCCLCGGSPAASPPCLYSRRSVQSGPVTKPMGLSHAPPACLRQHVLPAAWSLARQLLLLQAAVRNLDGQVAHQCFLCV